MLQRFSPRLVLVSAVVVLAAASVALAGSGDLSPGPLSRSAAAARAGDLAALGQRMFFDPGLSASGTLACSSCHDPAYGFGPSNAMDVQIGGPHMDQPGVRATPSLTYLQADPQFTEHFFDSDDEGDESVDNGPTGGLMWDGRADRASGQVRLPLTSPFEMANADAAAVAAKLSTAAYAADVRTLFGSGVLDDPEAALTAAGQAIAAFEQTPGRFYPYSSKYDAYLAGKATLSAQEMRGLKVFEAEDKGNCSSCHISQPANDGEPPQFSDFGLIALGVPRNPRLAINRDPAYFDLGACGPLRTDLKGRDEYCGIFRTPSLRNVALRQTFFHNGLYHSLRDAVAFYATRDTDPGRWYPKDARGAVEKYDDLPKKYWANINTDPPLGGKPGDKPSLSDADIDDIVAFLGTLTDGYAPAAN